MRANLHGDVSGSALALVMPRVSRASTSVERVKVVHTPSKSIDTRYADTLYFTMLDDAPAAQQRPAPSPGDRYYTLLGTRAYSSVEKASDT